MTSPTQRTLKFLRDGGHLAQVVERWNAYAKVRVDLFGVIDIVCVPLSGKGIIGVQACAGASHAARRTKSLAEPRLLTWLNAGGRFQIISWAKQGPRGKRKVWVPRVEEITADAARKGKG